jgi:hypothetical protein
VSRETGLSKVLTYNSCHGIYVQCSCNSSIIKVKPKKKNSIEDRAGFSGVHSVAGAQTLLADTSQGKDGFSSS